MLYCETCSETFESGKFCPDCGKLLILQEKEENICDNCKLSLLPGTKFCPECSTPVMQTAIPGACHVCGSTDNAENWKFCNSCSTGRIENKESTKKNITNNSVDTSVSDLSQHDEEYVEYLEDCYQDGLITEDERRILNKMKTKLNISDDRADELEATVKEKLCPQSAANEDSHISPVTDVSDLSQNDEKYVEYLEDCYQDGVITEDERRILNKMKAKLNISDDRADELEASVKKRLCPQPAVKAASPIAWVTDNTDVPEKDKDFKWYLNKAEQGDSEAQYEVGFNYYCGEDVEENFKAAFNWSFKAAKQGNVEALFLVGNMLYWGEGVSENKKKGVAIISKSADLGNPFAQKALGDIYFDGTDVDQNYAKAFECYKKASEQGNIEATEWLGNMYSWGLGVDTDLDKAFECYFEAAEAGIGSAQYAVGIFYWSGQSVNENDDEAFKWFRKAADNGFGMGFYNVGLFYYDGISVEQNYDEAIKQFKKGIEADNEESMIYLGTHHYHENKDVVLSKKYLQQAIQKGNATAMAVFAFITEVDDLSYDRTTGDLWIADDNMESDKLKGARKYAGDLVDHALVLWDSTTWGSGKKGFIITDSTKDFTIITDSDEPVSLLKKEPKIALHKMAYFIDKEPLVKAIAKLIELWEKYGSK